MERKELGDFGEALAGQILEQKGYVILDRNFRTRYGEVDLVAEDGEVLVFVEVKARRSLNYGSGRRLYQDETATVDPGGPQLHALPGLAEQAVPV